MNVLNICIDTLRRDFLGAYRDRPVGFDYAVETPNLDRFAERAAVFDTHYGGSLPTLPARRELLTGRQGFPWRSWGPLEPFDTTLAEKLRDGRRVTQIISDNYHLFEAGVYGYYDDFNGFELIRGHEDDRWKTSPRDTDPALRGQLGADDPHDIESGAAQYARNVSDFDPRNERDFFAPTVFETLDEWLVQNEEWDEWFCLADSFDVHQPFHCPEPYRSMYTDEDPEDPDLPVWNEGWLDSDYWTDRKRDFIRSQYAGKTTMLDAWLGRVLDTVDRLGMWDDTMVIVTADHGYCLGDHGYVGKNRPALYDELARLPLMIWHPDSPMMGERIDALTSWVDLHDLILDVMDADAERGLHSKSLWPLLSGEETDHREWALYGYFGTSVNVTDGRYTYFHPPRPDGPLYRYSSDLRYLEEPSFVWSEPGPIEDAEMGDYLPYTDLPVFRNDSEIWFQNEEPELYDTETDPEQVHNLVEEAPETVERMQSLMVEGLSSLEAPSEQYDRLGLEPP